MKKKSKNSQLGMLGDSWVEEFMEGMAIESIKILRDSKKPEGMTITNKMMSKFVKHFIHNLVLASLVEHSKVTPTSEAFRLTKDNFLEIKTSLASDIQKGFEDAFKSYAGKHVDYYCVINPVPEPVNKLPC